MLLIIFPFQYWFVILFAKLCLNSYGTRVNQHCESNVTRGQGKQKMVREKSGNFMRGNCWTPCESHNMGPTFASHLFRFMPIGQVFGPWAGPYGANDHDSAQLQAQTIPQSLQWRDTGSASLTAARQPARTMMTIPLPSGGLRGKKARKILYEEDTNK